MVPPEIDPVTASSGNGALLTGTRWEMAVDEVPEDRPGAPLVTYACKKCDTKDQNRTHFIVEYKICAHCGQRCKAEIKD